VFFFVDNNKEYSVAVYHDINSNNKCDKNIIRLTLEPYGFSNNIKPHFSSPSFSDVKFPVTIL
jgi:uncharacterized protein (DUF2141 family)